MMIPDLFKMILCTIVLCTNISSAQSQAVSTSKPAKQEAFVVTAKVDQRVELMSIVARLAGFKEYINNQFPLYSRDVDNYFDKYKQHPVVQFIADIRRTTGIGFDAVMAMAVHLNPPPQLTPRVAFSDQVPDARWGKDRAEKFAKLLQQFYTEAECERFFQSHDDLYRTAEQRFQSVTAKVDFDWYRRFYVEVPNGTFNLYIGLLNGGNNYGPKVVHADRSEDLYAIIGTSDVDKAGLPTYGDESLFLIIHEYNHSFINHLVFEHEEQLRAAGEKVFGPVAEKMKLLHYGNWQITLIESLVRTAVIRYQFEHNARPRAPYQTITSERGLGFLWVEELSALLGSYENSRDLHPTFRSFFPVVIGYFGDLAKRIDFLAMRFDELSPHVTSMSPFANGAQDVDPNVTQITFSFDRPLDVNGGHSFNEGPGGNEHDPLADVIGFTETGESFTIRVKLKPNWTYELIVTGRGFRTKDGYPLQTYVVKFKTR